MNNPNRIAFAEQWHGKYGANTRTLSLADSEIQLRLLKVMDVDCLSIYHRSPENRCRG